MQLLHTVNMISLKLIALLFSRCDMNHWHYFDHNSFQGSAASYSLTLQDHTDVFYIVPDSGVGFSNPAIKVKNTDLIDYDLGPKRYILHVRHIVVSFI